MLSAPAGPTRTGEERFQTWGGDKDSDSGPDSDSESNSGSDSDSDSDYDSYNDSERFRHLKGRELERERDE